jgi:hypothetical protein
MKTVLRTGGTLLITTRSKGFGVHAYPYDFWRYEIDDMKRIFGDLDIQKLERDPTRPGVFLKATKPHGFEASRLDDVSLYSIVKEQRALSVTEEEAHAFKPPFTLVGLLWSLLPTRVRTDGFRALFRGSRQKP